jgi:hypothetical protein
MTARRRTCCQAALALFAALAILAISSAAVIPGHWHDSPQDRACDICRTGCMPTLEPSICLDLRSPVAVEWHRHAVELTPVLEPVFAHSSPRAPPV